MADKRIKDLTNTAAESDIASDNYFALDGSAGTKKLNSTTLLTKTAQNALAGNVAPAFDPTRTSDNKYITNEFVTYGGKLYRFDVDHYGAWDSTHAHLAEVGEILQNIENDSLIFKDFFNTAVVSRYIKTNLAVGSSIDYTPVVDGSFSYTILPCKKGDLFKILGEGGSAARLWCFVDTSDKVVSVASAGAVLGGSYISAPTDGKLIFNSRKSVNPHIFKNVSSHSFYEEFDEYGTVNKNYVLEANESAYIVTNLDIGQTVDYTLVSNSSYLCVVVDCVYGESFFIRGAGGLAARLWCFVDTSDKVVSIAPTDTSTGSQGTTIVAPCDGKMIFNSSRSSSPLLDKRIPVQQHIDSFEEKTLETEDFLKTNALVKEVVSDGMGVNKKTRITTDVGVGNIVDLTPVFTNGWVSGVFDCHEGQQFFIRGAGGSAGRLWCFVDTSDKVVSVAPIDVGTGSEGTTIVAPCDGKMIFNSTPYDLYGGYYVKVYTSLQNELDDIKSNTGKNLSSLQDFEIPFNDAKCDHVMDFLSGLDLTNNKRIEAVYEGFDNLITDYPEFITKYDAAELLGLSYPRYANGISAGDPDYLETPAYKTYVYKVSNINAGAGNTTYFPKKKLLIIGGLHGDETFAPVNLYVLISHLMRDLPKDLFSIFSFFDIWVLPCLNGYSMYHPRRQNANGVDINRNFGTVGWHVDGVPGDHTYSGETPDSEFETQIVEGMFNYITPEFYVDHHSAGLHSQAQFYSEVSLCEKVFNKTYEALVRLSKFLITNYPYYFGTKFHLFKDSTNPGTTPLGYTDVHGQSEAWAAEHGAQSITIEVAGRINYLNGVYDPSGEFHDELWTINEFTLREQLALYLPVVLGIG